MADAILYGIAEEILKNVGSYLDDEIASAWGFKSDLDKLKGNVDIIKALLLDAEKKQTDSEAVRLWLISLTQVVYAADDLFDEFITVATRKQLNGRNKFSNEVHTFFSRYNQIAYAHRIARKIKVIRKELEGIGELGKKLELVSQSYVEGRFITKRRDQTYSFVKADEVIGRDADKTAILDLLLASSSSGNDQHEQRVLPVIAIVGIGGLGKTALAQYIYNDPSVKEFELMLWVCVSDVFDIKEITEKILKSATNSETPKLEMDQLQSRLRTEIGDKKYLLVLDDVWNESREEWLKMRALLIGKNGSKILVTTRSSKVATIMCTLPPYDLQGLSEEKSWELFEKLAFTPGQAQRMPQLVDIGKEIVQKCANVPLAIRIVGSILYGENESKWLLIRDKNLSKRSDKGIDHIMNILKISYHHLSSPLKNCFAYCALFPKDYNFNKDMMINLWMAEGFIVLATDESMSLEELGEEYFLTLLQRGLFQDVKKDEWGCIESCKMHDFIHDLAQNVAEPKCLVIKADQSFHLNNIYHLSFAFRLNFQRTIPSTVLSLRRLRTLLLPQQLSDGSTFSKCQQMISKLTYLRVLDLHALGLKNLPGSIGKLIHLRYLNLSSNPFTVLPDSITELHNLQTLNLKNCTQLFKLPSNIKKLVNLRSLDIDHCYPIFSHIPLGIGNLTSLHYLPLFIVTKDANSARLSELNKLKNLRGKLHIVFDDHLKTTMLEAGEGGLTDKHGLNELDIRFAMGECHLFRDLNKIVIPPKADSEHDEVVLEGLKPHRNLRKLKISHYQGRKLPSWAMNNSLVDTLSKLVEIELYEWNHYQLPAFSKLPLLKRLSLTRVLRVDYMEILNSDHSSSTNDQLFYPSLEILKLHNMISLKGWWKGSDASSSELGLAQAQPSLSFPRLLTLDVHYCENLTSLPTCPKVEKVHLSNETKNLSIMNIVTESSRLKSLTIDNVEDLLSIPSECLLELSWLFIKDSALLSTEKLGDLFATLSSSLKSLSFRNCENLISISKGLEHLTALETLAILSCDQLDLSPNERQPECENRDEYCRFSKDMPWKAFKTSLRSLKLLGLGKLVSLPSELQYLTNLRSLELSFNYRLRELPEWINCFSSLEYLKLTCCDKLTCLPESFKLAALQELRISLCPQLIKTCGGPNGKDLPKIKHIPLVIVEDYGSVVED